VHPAAQFCFQTAQLRHHPLARRFAPYDETAVAPPLPTVMCEAEKREGLRLFLSALFPNSFIDRTARFRQASFRKRHLSFFIRR
jgi:hypothetical protein